jgi:hypothetical protein
LSGGHVVVAQVVDLNEPGSDVAMNHKSAPPKAAAKKVAETPL